MSIPCSWNHFIVFGIVLLLIVTVACPKTTSVIFISSAHVALPCRRLKYYFAKFALPWTLPVAPLSAFAGRHLSHAYQEQQSDRHDVVLTFLFTSVLAGSPSALINPTHDP